MRLPQNHTAIVVLDVAACSKTTRDEYKAVEAKVAVVFRKIGGRPAAAAAAAAAATVVAGGGGGHCCCCC
jgi:hypothetical protein